jgi:protein-disulfide isomerase
MEDPKTAASIERSAREGEAAGVHGTPALYIKGLLPETVEIRRGVPAVLALIEAHRDGLKLPAPSPER